MAKTPRKPPLTLVGPTTTGTSPPRTLGRHGRKFWDHVMSDYDFQDIGGIEILAQICAALDRAEWLRAEIDRDGEVIRVRGVPRAHPALREELAARAFICRQLARLGLDLEPVRPTPGRPPGQIGWSSDDAD